MRHCTNCGFSVPDNAQHCPQCGKPLAGKKLSPIPFYLVGFVLLAFGGILLGKYLQNEPLSFNVSDGSVPSQIVEIPTQKLPAINNGSTLVIPTDTVIPPTNFPDTSEPQKTLTPFEDPVGKIVFTCQIYKDNNRNQICIMNADGTDQRRLTTDNSANHWYPSLAPDGKSIVFSSNQTGAHEIYEMDLNGRQTQLTTLGELYAPEISPNGIYIAFTYAGGTFSSIWIMNRGGSNPHIIYGSNQYDAVDPTWSPDGKRILFALGNGEIKKLHTIDVNGTDLQIVSDTFTTRGRSDWSPDGNKAAGYTGESWQRKIYLMNFDGSGLLELFSSGNVQAPSFSPDGGWVAFTGYIDNMGNEDGCEIYIMRLSDNKLERLTNNDQCDWQPRWGP